MAPWTYSSRALALLRSLSTSAGRTDFRFSRSLSRRSAASSVCPSAVASCTLPRLLSDGVVELLPFTLACLSKSPKLVGGCNGIADCTASFARCREEWVW